jgi:hypothetical protein
MKTNTAMTGKANPRLITNPQQQSTIQSNRKRVKISLSRHGFVRMLPLSLAKKCAQS